MNMQLDNKCYKGHPLITSQKMVDFSTDPTLHVRNHPNTGYLLHIVDSGNPGFILITPSPKPNPHCLF